MAAHEALGSVADKYLISYLSVLTPKEEVNVLRLPTTGKRMAGGSEKETKAICKSENTRNKGNPEEDTKADNCQCFSPVGNDWFVRVTAARSTDEAAIISRGGKGHSRYLLCCIPNSTRKPWGFPD